MKEMIMIGLSVLGISLIVIFALTIPTMWLWNYVMPTVFGMPEVSVFQTLALLFLAEIFFKSNRSSNK